MARTLRLDSSVTKQKLRPGTVKRIVTYARPYRWLVLAFLLASAADASLTVANPLLLREVIDRGVLRRDDAVVIGISAVVAGVAIFDAVLNFITVWFSARVGTNVICDLRTQVFRHVQRQPVAFFTRAQTGSLVSRLDGDVVGAQSAVTSTLSTVVANVLRLVVVLGALFYLSWLVTVIALVIIPLFMVPAKRLGRRLRRLTREGMQLNAEIGSVMTERFNVAGAMLVKLFGRPEDEVASFSATARKIRDLNVSTALYGQVFFVAMTLFASMVTAVVYGVGGTLAVHGTFQLGTLVALAALLNRVYGPISALMNAQVSVMTALVSFERVFEVLDLKPIVDDRPGALELPLQRDGAAPDIVLEEVSFRYPSASEVSLASLESIVRRVPERTDAAAGVLHDITFRVPPGRLTALVGPSGAGKTTITSLVARFYDPDSGAVRVGGLDLRDVTQRSLHDVVGIVTQDPHLFHDSIRTNLLYARPDASEADLVEACEAAQIWELISALPDGLDTIVGDRGYRLSGGEKQRIALARILLKAPSVVILDEATAHLDSESEAAVQRALKVALSNRTSLVIAHRLSTVREADQILVIDGGRVVESGRHEDLLAACGVYADLYRTQFAIQD
jgi:ATP-binding cassette subfamily B protein